MTSSLQFYIFSFFILINKSIVLTKAQCLLDQSKALIQLKQGFATSKNLNNWNPSTDCCTWEGVKCDGFTGRVTSLDLTNKSISGELDPSLFNLTSLENLSLAYNLFDQIPFTRTGFERLPNLTYLNLSNSGFTGQIPIGISRLTNLISLDISTFNLNTDGTSSVNHHGWSFKTLLANLTKLRILHLDGVNISSNGSEWGQAISQLGPTLQDLSLSSCSLTGPIDQSLIQLKQISLLNLNQNNLNSLVPEFFANFSSLSVLRLSSCGLGGEFPSGIFELEKLRSIDLSLNPLLSGILPHFRNKFFLQSLILSNTNFSGSLPDSIDSLQDLSRLILFNCSFYGELPYSLTKLARLVYLDISSNTFSGKIPQLNHWLSIRDLILANNNFTGEVYNLDYTGLINLTMLDLRNNSLVGTVPISLFSLPSLQFLFLSQNQFSGNLSEFSNGSLNLRTIDLSSNNLRGLVPVSFFNLSGLSVLNLSSNNFTGTLNLNSIKYLKELTNLDLSNNELSIIDGTTGTNFYDNSFPQITTLKLISCNLTKLPSFLQYQHQISTLDLSNNKIHDLVPEWIYTSSNQTLVSLNLSHNLLTNIETQLLNFQSLMSLLILDFHSNLLNGSLPLSPPSIIVLDFSNNFFSLFPSNFFSSLEYAIYLSLSNNTLTGTIPNSICNMSYLQVLDLSYNKLNGPVPNCLLNGTNSLAVLNLKNNELSGNLPRDINPNCGLRTLNLFGNEINGVLPKSLMNCTSLEVLDLGNNKIWDNFPFWLGNLQNLTVLILRSNNFHGPISNNVSNSFPMVKIFDISSNNFSGVLPKDYFLNLNAMKVNSEKKGILSVGFKYLEYSKNYYQNSVMVTFKGLDFNLVNTLAIFNSLDFSKNQFGGKIPEEIGELKLLDLLNISHNSLIGSIPAQIGNLNQLESLDLSFNQLSGEIPQELTSLTFLSSLNLSYNNLQGKIPQIQQFLTFSNNSYINDSQLCGNPLSKPCIDNLPIKNLQKCSIGIDWEFILIGLGFGVGLGFVIGPLLVWNEGQNWYFGILDRVLLAIMSSWICVCCVYKRVGSEYYESGPVETEEEEEEEEEENKFCLFCTELEMIGDRLFIRHVDCTCSVH